MPELITNLHIHTTYSDGSSTHNEIAKSALETDVDVLIITDHNSFPKNHEGYFENSERKILMLIGEEIHDTERDPQKNHLLVFGLDRDVKGFAQNPQNLINQVIEENGLAFIAHPFESALPMFNEPDISWVDWQVDGFTGIELWNGLSELKDVILSPLHAIFYAFFPQFIAHAPPQASVKLWDNLLLEGKKVVVIGGSDSHALKIKYGFLKKTIFPYKFHFRSVNTHLIVKRKLSDRLDDDKTMILDALRQGHAFIGYDLAYPTSGFRFTAQGKKQEAVMGDEIDIHSGVTFQIKLPKKTECVLLKDGIPIKIWKRKEFCTFISDKPGVYRVEVYINYLGKRRCWIISNPIYVK